jgi:predicted metal-dependent peptidase
VTTSDAIATERAVSATLLRICSRSPFFATLALHAKIKITNELPTAATDGRDVFVNPEFFNKLTPAAQDGLLLHEVLHAALLHVPRRGNRDPKLWNIAADVVINGMLIRDGYTLPEGGVRDPSREHMATEEVYEALLKQAKPQPELGMLDLMDGETMPGSAGDSDAQAGDKPISKAELEGHWKKALQEARMVAQSSLAGDLPGHLQREIGQILRTQVDWRSYLWRYLVQTPTDFGSFDRRFVGDGMYLETIAGETVHVHVCVDTSGSIQGGEINAFMSEVQSILHAYPHLRCELYYADAKLYGPHTIMPDSVLPKPEGGGGTDFRPFFNYLEQHSDRHTTAVAIYLTDGYGNFPRETPAISTLWVVTPGGKEVDGFPFGEVIRLLPNG